MGSSTSKAASKATSASAQSTVRKYPTRTPPTSSPQVNRPPHTSSKATSGPTVHPSPQASNSRDPTIDKDASDPDILVNRRARQLGPVQPNPTYSHTSATSVSPTPNPNPPSTQFQPSASNPTQQVYPSAAAEARSNPAVSLLRARYRIAEEAEREFEGLGRTGAEGRRFIDVKTLGQALALRDERGVDQGEVERRLGLRNGILKELGGSNVLSSVGYDDRT